MSASISGRPLDTATAQWVANLGSDLHDKLAATSLVEPRQTAVLGEFIDAYIASRSEVEDRD